MVAKKGYYLVTVQFSQHTTSDTLNGKKKRISGVMKT